MTARPSPGCLACAARAPELHEDARGTPIYSIDLGWRIAARVERIDGAWITTGPCHVITADGDVVPVVALNSAEIGRLMKAVEEIQ